MIDLLQLLAALLAAAFVAALALAGFSLVRKLLRRSFPAGPAEPAARDEQPALLRLLRRSVVALLAALTERGAPAEWLEQLDRVLRKAGAPCGLRAAELLALAQLLAVLSSGLALVLSVGLEFGPLTCLGLAALGAGAPFLWLRDKLRARQKAITRALPYNLDLLTLSVEAGLDFAAALGKVVASGRQGPLTEELGITLKELRLGKTREEALRNLGRRVDLQSLSSFVHALVQADKMGTSLGKALRIQSTQLRIERTQRAEKLANEAPIKLLVPLIGCIFPTIFILLFGPIAYQVFFAGSF